MKSSKVRYVVIQDLDVVAHILEHVIFGLVVVFLVDEVSILHPMKIYDLDIGAEIDSIELLELVLYRFPNEQNTKEKQTGKEILRQG